MGTFLLTRRDGTLIVLRTVGDTTPEQALAKWPPQLREPVVETRPISEDDVPKDYTFRDAWVSKNPAKPIEVDLDKAKDVWRNNLRTARRSRLASLDIEFIRAEEIGDEAKKAEIVVKKQSLRDLPQDPRIEQAKDPEELKSIWHPELEPLEALLPPPKKEEKEEKK